MKTHVWIHGMGGIKQYAPIAILVLTIDPSQGSRTIYLANNIEVEKEQLEDLKGEISTYESRLNMTRGY